jgi:hypothetical protein
MAQEREKHTMKKMTKKDYFNQLLKNYNLTTDEINFINHEIELLESKNSSNNKRMTANQKDNEKLKNDILDVMVDDTAYSVTDIQKLLGLESNQKTSALLRQLKDDGKVIRFEEKRKAFFKKA